MDKILTLCEKCREAMGWLADLYISDCKENRDKQMEYGKGKRDELILKMLVLRTLYPLTLATALPMWMSCRGSG